jgi:hypothetical protein
MTLYADPEVKLCGVAVGGIRISAVSHIEQPTAVMITETRGKRKAMTIQPIVVESIAPKPTMGDRVGKAVAAYQSCKTSDELMTIAKKCEPLAAECDEANRDTLSEAYQAAMERVNKAVE